MRVLGFIISFLLTLAYIVVLDNSWGSIPPVGRFLDPINGFYHNALNGMAESESLDRDLEGLQDSATVIFDQQLIPHIFATNLHDAYYLQGYTVARHRLWQMEVQTHYAAGRLTEIFGPGMLETDKLTRRRGLGLGARRSLAAMQSDSLTKLAVTAYTKGVNEYINSLQYADYPFEYKLLNTQPEPWTELKSAYLLMYMAQDLAGYDDDLENTNLVQFLGKDEFDSLYVSNLPGVDPVIPPGTTWDFTPIQVTKPDSVYTEILSPETNPKPNPQNGSNNWAVNGTKSATGNPILCNDPHLSLNLPSIWYAVQLHTPEMNVYGVSLPGAPGVVIGFNNNIAWGVTNATRDVKDWYKLTFKDSLRNEYLYDGKWLRFDKQPERYVIVNKGLWQKDEVVTDTILYSHYGPVVYDRNYSTNAELVGYAMRWTAHDPGNSLQTFLKLNQAKNLDDYQQALNSYRAPGQNFVFASTSGDIAMRVQGRYPVKWEEQGKFLMDGSNSAYEWQAFIPAEQNAMVVNPPRNFVSSANQTPVDATYPYYVFDDTYEHYRNRRINNFLSEKEKVSVEDMKKLQNDNFSMQAQETLPIMLSLLDSTQLKEEELLAVNYLKQWNYMAEATQLAPTYYYAWWENTRKMLWDELDSLEFATTLPSNAQTAYFLQNQKQSKYYDYKNTPARENAQAFITLTFKRAMQDVANWRQENPGKAAATWGNWKNSSILHLTRQPALSYTDLQVNGGRSIVNANSGRHGASWRMIVELGSPVKAWVVYPGGQSGNPGSPHYANMISNWQNGQYYPALFLQEASAIDSTITARRHYTPLSE
jgi:penicillin amidase